MTIPRLFAFCLLVSSGAALRADFSIEPDLWEIGEIREGAKTNRSFTVRNGASRPLKILELVRTCTCGEVAIDRTEIPAGETAVYSLAIDPGILAPGPFVKTFYLRTDDPGRPVAGVMARGSVVPEWEVKPAKSIRAETGESAVFEVAAKEGTASFGEPALFDSAGERLELPVAMERMPSGALRVSFKVPPAESSGYREWTIALPSSDGNRTLKLSVASGHGESWRCEPRRVKLPRAVEGNTEIRFLMSVDAALSTRYSMLRPEEIALVDPPDGVEIAPAGTVTWKSVPMKIVVSEAAAAAWTARKLVIKMPGGAAAALFVE